MIHRKNLSLSDTPFFSHVEAFNENGEQPDQTLEGWYMSGLKYGRDIGVIIYGVDENQAEEVLRDYLIENIAGYNDGFYGLGEIPFDPSEPLGEVIEINL